MAVTPVSSELAYTPSTPSVWCFVRLKLRLLANSMHGSTQRVLTVLTGLMFGALGAMLGFAAFAGGLAASSNPDRRFVIVVGAGTLLTAGWLLLPLLFFGVDETLDPARFAVLPLPRAVLARGMLAAACIGIPAAMTLVALLGLVVGGAIRGGVAAAAVALVAVVVALGECVVFSRSLTSAFASMLRTRRMRDLGAIVIAILASSLAPLQMAVSSLLETGNVGRVLGIARVVAWTPLGAPFGAVVDATEGRWAGCALRLTIGAVTIPVLLWWWSRTMESAMLATGSGGAGGAPLLRDGWTIARFFPLALRRLPAAPFTAIMARELRYWAREPRRRAAVASLVMSSCVVPLMLRMPQFGNDRDGLPMPIIVVFPGVVIAIVLANQFGMDGTAYALHLLTGVRGRVELLARGAALALFGVPLLVTIAVGAALVFDGASVVPATMGAALAAFGVSLGAAFVTSVVAPYPMPDSSNPFAMNSGTGTAKGAYSLVAILVSTAATVPVLICYALLPGQWSVLVGPIGLGWGVAGAGFGAYVAGNLLDRRGPEILQAVTPRR